MTTIVLVVLAIAWGVVLFFWLRSRSKGAAFSDSVGLFHRHLRVLERTAPSTLKAANRMRGYEDGPIPLSVLTGRHAPSVNRPATRRVAPAGLRVAAARPSATASYRRRQSRRRRRDVLFVLAVLVVATLVLAVGTGSHALLMAQVVSDVALAGYVGLLVRLRSLAAERDMKLRVMQRPALQGAYAGYGDMALRRVAN